MRYKTGFHNFPSKQQNLSKRINGMCTSLHHHLFSFLCTDLKTKIQIMYTIQYMETDKHNIHTCTAHSAGKA